MCMPQDGGFRVSLRCRRGNFWPFGVLSMGQIGFFCPARQNELLSVLLRAAESFLLSGMPWLAPLKGGQALARRLVATAWAVASCSVCAGSGGRSSGGDAAAVAVMRRPLSEPWEFVESPGNDMVVSGSCGGCNGGRWGSADRSSNSLANHQLWRRKVFVDSLPPWNCFDRYRVSGSTSRGGQPLHHLEIPVETWGILGA